MTEKQPKGYEIAADQKAFENIQAAIITDIKLRQWCIEKAMEACADELVITLAERILDFIAPKPTPK